MPQCIQEPMDECLYKAGIACRYIIAQRKQRLCFTVFAVINFVWCVLTAILALRFSGGVITQAGILCFGMGVVLLLFCQIRMHCVERYVEVDESGIVEMVDCLWRAIREYPGCSYGRPSLLRGLCRCITQRDSDGVAMYVRALVKAVPEVSSTVFVQTVTEAFRLPTAR